MQPTPTTYINDRTAKKLASDIFGYTGRTFKVRASNTYRLNNYWSDGSIEKPVLVAREELNWFHPSQDAKNPFKAIAHTSFEIPVGHFLMVEEIVMGKHRGITLICREDELEKALPTENEALTVAQKVVLYCYYSYKSSYAGISGYRKKEGLAFIASSEYDQAKQSLIERKFISKANSLTQAGKNAAVAIQFRELPKRTM
jgi:hypothetical protein